MNGNSIGDGGSDGHGDMNGLHNGFRRKLKCFGVR